jgi:hypothetical protein
MEITDFSFITQLLSLAAAGKVVLAVFVGLLGLTKLATKLGPLIPGPVGLAFHSPLAAWIVPLVLSELSAVVTALTAGSPISLNLLLSALIPGLMAGGIIKAEAKGAAASAAIDDKAKAVEGLK